MWKYKIKVVNPYIANEKFICQKKPSSFAAQLFSDIIFVKFRIMSIFLISEGFIFDFKESRIISVFLSALIFLGQYF